MEKPFKPFEGLSPLVEILEFEDGCLERFPDYSHEQAYEALKTWILVHAKASKVRGKVGARAAKLEESAAVDDLRGQSFDELLDRHKPIVDGIRAAGDARTAEQRRVRRALGEASIREHLEAGKPHREIAGRVARRLLNCGIPVEVRTVRNWKAEIT